MQWLRERVSTTVSQEPAAGAAEFFPISPIDPLGCASTRAIQKWSQNNLAASTFITNNITKMKISSGPQKSTFIIWIHAIVQFNTILIRLSCEFSRVHSCEVFAITAVLILDAWYSTGPGGGAKRASPHARDLRASHPY